MKTKYKRKDGEIDFRASHRVKPAPMMTIMGYLYPKRTESEVYLNQEFDVTELLKYIDKKNEQHPEYKTTMFHCFVTIIARMVRERPLMNRFIQGYRCYEREVVSLGFAVRRRFVDDAEESMMILIPKDDDTVDSISRKIVGDVKETRKSEKATGGVDEVLETFSKFPRFLLMIIVKIVRWLDFWGNNIKALSDGDYDYASVLLSNLGSIKTPSIYHHLNNYGTNSFMITIGTMHKEKKLMEDGSEQIRDILDVGAVIDERIGDGFYFGRSLKLVQYCFAHPELLDKPLGEPSGYEYE